MPIWTSVNRSSFKCCVNCTTEDWQRLGITDVMYNVLMGNDETSASSPAPFSTDGYPGW
ncbi:hypothetical protein [uncultured Nostoc sp.]|uniref:hypothetical protein n=1 Tax=uncultured Nostoc sp. TaxID=340711 RepID=UPI0035C989D0